MESRQECGFVPNVINAVYAGDDIVNDARELSGLLRNTRHRCPGQAGARNLVRLEYACADHQNEWVPAAV